MNLWLNLNTVIPSKSPIKSNSNIYLKYVVWEFWLLEIRVRTMHCSVQSGQSKRLRVHCTRSAPVHCTRTAPGSEGTLYLVCPGTLYPHCPPGRPIRGQEIYDNQSWSAMGGSAGTMYPHYPGQWGYIVPGQTGYNVPPMPGQ